jgi:peptidyl-prolyl cis-trans isomerase C
MLPDIVMSKNLIIMVICTLIAGCSGDNSPIVANVNSIPIKSSSLEREMILESGKYDPATLSIDANFNEFRKQALDKLIQESILLEEANALNIAASKEELEHAKLLQSGGLDNKHFAEWLSEHGLKMKDWDEIISKRVTIDKLIKKQVYDNIPIPKKKIEAYYKKHIQNFRQPTQFRALQIIVDEREVADRIISELKQGADFAALAKKHSMSPDGKRGGDLGYFDAGAYPEVFAEVCQKLNIGETSEVIVTDYGYQIFQLLDRRPPRQLSLADVTPLIRKTLAEDQSEIVFKKWLEELNVKYNVNINDKILSEVKLDDKSS